jgi:tRNA threonylcarbamoyladenosine biosynthesis protein TsaE
MTTITSQSAEDTQQLAHKVLDALEKEQGKAGTASIIALKGELGAGKTVFTKGIATYLGVKETVTSPTFVIEKKYTIPNHDIWEQLIHIDAYRLEGEDDLGALDWHTIATNPKNLVVVEWPEQVGLGIPERAHWIEFETVDTTTRAIQLPEQFFVEE